jgi:hypothetical protein
LVRALLGSSPLDRARLRPWHSVAEGLTHFNVVLRRVGDLLPGAGRRASRRALRGDVWQERGLRLATKAAERDAITDTPYSHHDTSVPSDT